MNIDQLIAKRLVPDFVISLGIKYFLKQRLREDVGSSTEVKEANKRNFLSKQKTYDSIAVQTQEAKEQHYEVPTEFYDYCLGPYKKYSCCYFNSPKETIEQGEKNMLEITCERAQIKDGESVLELGCGWGSLSLFMAEKFPNSSITALCNSQTQKAYIEKEKEKRGLKNLTIYAQDINTFVLDQKFDRVVSVEMFEHMRNYQMLLEKVASMMKDDATLFVHIFVHKDTPYFFDVKDESDWMSKYFFSGGIMPSDDIFEHYSDFVKVIEKNKVNGTHYGTTAQKWLENTDLNKEKVLKLFQQHYGDEAKKWYEYWRIFFMSCRELWNYKNGNEWFVGHYLMKKNNSSN